MDDLLSLDIGDYADNPEWQEVVQNGAQPELSGILKRVSGAYRKREPIQELTICGSLCRDLIIYT